MECGKLRMQKNSGLHLRESRCNNQSALRRSVALVRSSVNESPALSYFLTSKEAWPTAGNGDRRTLLATKLVGKWKTNQDNLAQLIASRIQHRRHCSKLLSRWVQRQP